MLSENKVLIQAFSNLSVCQVKIGIFSKQPRQSTKLSAELLGMSKTTELSFYLTSDILTCLIVARSHVGLEKEFKSAHNSKSLSKTYKPSTRV